jgi:hypothetical protein
MTLSLEMKGTGGWADYSPNNRGFAMADRRALLNVHVTGNR